jgi:formyl-CoA transferase
MSGALSHLRVLDLTRVLAGPWCSQVLADLGAEVIKVERRESGDDTRAWAPPYLKDEAGNDTTEAAYFLSCNRGKKSVTLDISTSEGQDLVRRLAHRSDIVIENFKLGDLERYDLGYQKLRELNPGLIYCSITGFGQTGPWKHRAGYDLIVQGLCGLMSITGEREGLPGGGPQKVGIAVTDVLTGLYATVGILSALAHRERTGEGQCVDMALLDVGVGIMSNVALNYFASGDVPQRWGNAHPKIVPYQTFECHDGHLIVGAGNDGQFRKLCEVAGEPALAQDERFMTNEGRVRNREALVATLAPIFRPHDRAWWVERLESVGVPCGPINDVAEVFENAQVRARAMKIDLPHPLAGHVPLVRNPIRLSGTPLEYRSPPPTLGQHTDEVLGGLLGLGADELARLRESKVI